MLRTRPRRRAYRIESRALEPRFERNACWRCSYPTEQIDICPECGANTRRFGVPGVKRPQEWLAVQLFVLRLVRLSAIAAILSVVASLVAYPLPIGPSGRIAIVAAVPLAMALLLFRSGLPPAIRVGSPLVVYVGVPASLAFALLHPAAGIIAVAYDSFAQDTAQFYIFIALFSSFACSTLILLVLERAELGFHSGLRDWKPLVGIRFAVVCAFLCFAGFCTIWFALPILFLLYPCVLVGIVVGSRQLEKHYRSLSVVPE